MPTNHRSVHVENQAFSRLVVRGQRLPWHCLNFIPLPHGQGSFLPTSGDWMSRKWLGGPGTEPGAPIPRGCPVKASSSSRVKGDSGQSRIQRITASACLRAMGAVARRATRTRSLAGYS
jgi:hypothetical protein